MTTLQILIIVMTMFLGISLGIAPLSIGIIDSEGIEMDWRIQPSHAFSEQLISQIDTFLQQNNHSFSDCRAIGVVTGPGSYTGLRIGVTCANTISYVARIPVFGFSALDAMVSQYRHCSGTYLAILPACRRDVSVALFGTNQQQVTRLSDDVVISQDMLIHHINQMNGALTIIGQWPADVTDHIAERPQIQSILNPALSGATVAEMARLAFENTPAQNPHRRVVPMYTHLPNGVTS